MFRGSAASCVAACTLLLFCPTARSLNLPPQNVEQGGVSDSITRWKKPWYYHNLEGPIFKIVSRPGDKFEERRYERGIWVSTSVQSISYGIAVSTGFKKLFGYISGANSKNETLAMTVPVRVKVMPGQGPFCSNTFTTSFWVPAFKQDHVPTPDDMDVFVDHTPEETFFVTSFGGFALDPVVILKAKAAVSELQGLNVSISTEYFQTAGYDAPYTLLHRHNEIWIPAAAEHTTTVI